MCGSAEPFVHVVHVVHVAPVPPVMPRLSSVTVRPRDSRPSVTSKPSALRFGARRLRWAPRARAFFGHSLRRVTCSSTFAASRLEQFAHGAVEALGGDVAQQGTDRAGLERQLVRGAAVAV